MIKTIVFMMMVCLMLGNAQAQEQKLQIATFAGGCFWCMEGPFEKLDGVSAVISGFSAGKEENPTYQQVSAGKTGHTEAVQITFDSSKVSFEKLLEVFWRNIDPTQVNGQFADHGRQYRTGIYFHNEQQKHAALNSKKALEDLKKFNKPIVTEIVQFTSFYPAEEYHQDYYRKNPEHYNRYRTLSGRAPFLKKTWGDEH